MQTMVHAMPIAQMIIVVGDGDGNRKGNSGGGGGNTGSSSDACLQRCRLDGNNDSTEVAMQ